jgi:hypothetical protein
MAKQEKQFVASGYITMDPIMRGGAVTGVKLGKITKTRPRTPGVVVRLDVSVPQSAFEAKIALIQLQADDLECVVRVGGEEAE